jgi:hypothetical protein
MEAGLTPGLLFGGALSGGAPMSLGTIFLLVVLVAVIGALPTWPHSRQWGYYPSGGLGLVLVILLVLVLMGQI